MGYCDNDAESVAGRPPMIQDEVFLCRRGVHFEIGNEKGPVPLDGSGLAAAAMRGPVGKLSSTPAPTKLV